MLQGKKWKDLTQSNYKSPHIQNKTPSDNTKMPPNTLYLDNTKIEIVWGRSIGEARAPTFPLTKSQVIYELDMLRIEVMSFIDSSFTHFNPPLGRQGFKSRILLRIPSVS